MENLDLSKPITVRKWQKGHKNWDLRENWPWRSLRKIISSQFFIIIPGSFDHKSTCTTLFFHDKSLSNVLSRQITIIPKPALSAFGGDSLTKPPHFMTNRRSGRYNLPSIMELGKRFSRRVFAEHWASPLGMAAHHAARNTPRPKTATGLREKKTQILRWKKKASRVLIRHLGQMYNLFSSFILDVIFLWFIFSL